MNQRAVLSSGAFEGTRRLPGMVSAGVLVGLLCLPGSLRAATLTGSFASLPISARVNLSAEGTLDWGHWGLVNEWTYNHKYGMPQQITFSIITDEFATDGPYLLETGESDFCWNDGTASRLTASTTNGVSVFGDKLPGNVWTGFRLQWPADAGLRRLKLDVGTSGAGRSRNQRKTGNLPRISRISRINPLSHPCHPRNPWLRILAVIARFLPIALQRRPNPWEDRRTHLSDADPFSPKLLTLRSLRSLRLFNCRS